MLAGQGTVSAFAEPVEASGILWEVANLGRSSSDQYFPGQMDDVRVWGVSTSISGIRDSMKRHCNASSACGSGFQCNNQCESNLKFAETFSGAMGHFEGGAAGTAVRLNNRGYGETSTIRRKTSAPTKPGIITVWSVEATLKGDEAYLQWNPPNDIGGVPIQGYRIYISPPNQNAPIDALVFDGLSLDATITHLQSGACRGVRIRFFCDNTRAILFRRTETLEARGFQERIDA